ncbi:MAG: DnaD domain protein [Bacilli bacterium]|nr:DnaD domain protein [Bacilli bacterium]
MKNKILVDILKSKVLVIPMYIYRLKDKLELNEIDFIILMYFYNKGDNITFDVNQINKDLGIQAKDIMTSIGELTSKKLIDFKNIKNDKGITEEYISLEDFYNKVSLLLMDEEVEEKEEDTNIFTDIEREFGRTLSPMEYEIVRAWIENNFTEELIRCALEEAVLNGVSNLRYIDKILFEWSKKGIKTKEDVEKNRMDFRKKEESKQIEVFDYNWLDDENK